MGRGTNVSRNDEPDCRRKTAPSTIVSRLYETRLETAAPSMPKRGMSTRLSPMFAATEKTCEVIVTR